MKVLDKIIYSQQEPRNTGCLWAKPVQGGVAFYMFDGKWKLFKLMSDMGTTSPLDDQPIEVSAGGQVGPNTVDSASIIDGSISMDDLNEEVKKKLTNTYVQDDESMVMDYNIFG